MLALEDLLCSKKQSTMWVQVQAALYIFVLDSMHAFPGGLWKPIICVVHMSYYGPP